MKNNGSISDTSELNNNLYSYDEVYKSTLDYFSGDTLATDVFVGKYALQDNNGNFLERNPDQMHARLAKEFARIEKKYPNPICENEIFELMRNFQYIIPQGSPMSAIGNKYQIQSTGNCFVIESPYDSYPGILKTDQELACLARRRAGVGFDISTIRPKGLSVANAAKVSDGIGIFMERFSNTCREVAQSGRRGALLLSISVHHPDIETFIKIKRDLKKVTGANISIRVTDEFMNAVKNNLTYEQRFPVEVDVEHKVKKNVDANYIWNLIIENAHAVAEPGILFWDTALRNTPSDIYSKFGFKSISTNPCGEIILNEDSCRLLLVNLYSFVENKFTDDARFDFDKFSSIVRKAQRLMDDMVDIELEHMDTILKKIESDPEPDNVKDIEISLWKRLKQNAINGRRTGLGITGLGDCLAALGIKYGSKLSIDVTEEIYKQLAINSYHSSCILAKERGAFPIFSHELEKDHQFIKQILNAGGDELRQLYRIYGRRNIANTTTAPAGSVSTLTRTTSGIEGAIWLSYIRRKKINSNDKNSRVDFIDELGDKWQEYTVYHNGFKDWMNVTGLTDPKDSPYWNATSDTVDWKASVDLQGAAQKWICHAISKTCNLPSDVSIDVVKEVYMRAWTAGCKGFTVYRDGSRTGVLVKDNSKADKNVIIENNAPKRPKQLSCDLHHANIKGKDGKMEHWLVIVSMLHDKPYEVFCGLAENVEINKKYKHGYVIKNAKKDGVAIYDLVVKTSDVDCEEKYENIVELFDNPIHGAFTRTISLSLRHGISINYIVEQLQKDKNSDMMSFSKVIARVLKGYIPNGTKSTGDKTCPNCGLKDLVYQEGCVSCVKGCGWSKCQ